MIDPLYSELGIEYQQAYSGPYRPMDIKKNDGTVILALKDRRLSGYGRPSVCFGNSESVIHEFVDAYMQTPRVNYMDYMEGGKVTEITRFLMKQGRVPLIAFTQIIDLTQSEDDLHKEVRKSYQNLSSPSSSGSSFPCLRTRNEEPKNLGDTGPNVQTG
jgi:hypothetical protein